MKTETKKAPGRSGGELRTSPHWTVEAAHAVMGDDSEHIEGIWGDGGTGGPGWYAYDSEYPDEGSVFLPPPVGGYPPYSISGGPECLGKLRAMSRRTP